MQLLHRWILPTVPCHRVIALLQIKTLVLCDTTGDHPADEDRSLSIHEGEIFLYIFGKGFVCPVTAGVCTDAIQFRGESRPYNPTNTTESMVAEARILFVPEVASKS